MVQCHFCRYYIKYYKQYVLYGNNGIWKMQMYSDNQTDPHGLTERELDVLRYLMEGLTNKEIADKLTVTHHTVKAHVASIIRKLGARNRLDVAMIAQKARLLNLPQD
ncbi:response regulator transcription factor [bacterium]|nr:response regulator transcription factor [bacterium]